MADDLGPDTAPLVRSLSLGRAPRPLQRQVSFERSIPHDRMPPSVSSRFNSVVLFEVSGVKPDYLRPWQKGGQTAWTGSGFAIAGRRILTNFHVTEHATDIRLRKHGHSKRFAGRVLCQGADVDLAVVVVTEESDFFWEGVPAISFARDLPPLQSSVNVVGYPSGSKTICVTEGVVSRVDAKNYRLGGSSAAHPGKILVVQIDAAINGGNSGGPVFDAAGDVAGVAFQGLGGNAQNVGYVIPSVVALNFLHRVATAMGGMSGAAAGAEGGDGAKLCPYIGVPEMPFRVQSLQNKSLRKMLGVAPGMSGVVVTSVSPLARASAIAAAAQAKGEGEGEGAGEGGREDGEAGGEGEACFPMVDDVVTHIDGKPVGDDFTVPLRGEELVAADFLVTGKRCDERTVFTVLRGGRALELGVTLGPLASALPRTHGADAAPNWQLIGGLLFVPLSCPLVDMDLRRLYDSGYHSVSVEAERLMRAFRADRSSEVILLIDILTCDTNFGYDLGHSWRVLSALNGVAVENMAHLHALYADACAAHAAAAAAVAEAAATTMEEGEEVGEGGGGGDAAWQFLKFVFKDKSRIVLETESCVACEADVLAANGLPAAASPFVVAAAAARKEEEAAKKGVQGGGE